MGMIMRPASTLAAYLLFISLQSAALAFTPKCLTHYLRPRHKNLLPTYPRPAASSSVQSPDPIASIDALDNLVPRSQIKALSQKSNKQGIIQVAFHFSLVAAAAAIPVPFTLSLLATSFVSSFYFNGMHETIHRTAFRSNLLNYIFAQVFGFLCFRPARHYYYYHWQHHRYTGNPDLDSELQPGFLDFPVNSIWGYLLYLSGIPFWIDAVFTTVKHSFGHCAEAYLTNARARKEVSKEARIYLALYASIALVALAYGKSISSPLLRLWVLPALLGQPFLRFYLIAEHRGRKETPIIYENTRSMTGTNSFYRKLAWQMPYHIEHHAWPSIPFHRLARAHDLLVRAGGSEDNVDGNSGHDLLNRGELYADLKQSGRGGYIDFNRKFLRHLSRSKAKA